jgi:hypothetical protein
MEKTAAAIDEMQKSAANQPSGSLKKEESFPINPDFINYRLELRFCYFKENAGIMQHARTDEWDYRPQNGRPAQLKKPPGYKTGRQRMIDRS